MKSEYKNMFIGCLFLINIIMLGSCQREGRKVHYRFLVEDEYKTDAGGLEIYGKKDDDNVSLDNNFIRLILNSQEIYSPEKEDQFYFLFHFEAFNIKRIHFNKVIIIKENNRLDVTNRLTYVNWMRNYKNTYIDKIDDGIFDFEYHDDNFSSAFYILLEESTITVKNKVLYIEYDFDVEFINGHRENFNKTVKLIMKNKIKEEDSLKDVLGMLFLKFMFKIYNYK
jgi:hypothetical protein